jgi:hypothetical protein
VFGKEMHPLIAAEGDRPRHTPIGETCRWFQQYKMANLNGDPRACLHSHSLRVSRGPRLRPGTSYATKQHRAAFDTDRQAAALEIAYLRSLECAARWILATSARMTTFRGGSYPAGLTLFSPLRSPSLPILLRHLHEEIPALRPARNVMLNLLRGEGALSGRRSEERGAGRQVRAGGHALPSLDALRTPGAKPLGARVLNGTGRR